MKILVRQFGQQRRMCVRMAVLPAVLVLCTSPAVSQAMPATVSASKEAPAAQAAAPSAVDRRKAMQADIDRLLQLATRLKAEVDSSRKDELSIKVIRDADEIEKLARSARGRIR